MSLPLNSIGTHTFLSLKGEWDAPREDLEPILRPGVDGLALWRTGERGHPFTMRSKVDCADLGDAHDRADQYRTLIGQDAVELVKLDVPSTAYGFLVAVVSVQSLVVRKLLGGSGGLNYPSLAWLEAEWTLVAVASG